MAERPAFVQLKLTNPRLGTDENPHARDTIRWLQNLINTKGTRYVRPALPVDGIFGDWTAQETEELFYRLGREWTAPAVSIKDVETLWRWSNGEPLPKAWQARRLARMATGFRKGWGITTRSWIGLHPGQYAEDFDPADAADVMIDWANSGYKESPAGSNKVPPLMTLGRSLGAKATFYNMGYQWCQYAAYLGGLAAGGQTAQLGLVDGAFWPLYTPTTLALGQQMKYGHIIVPSSQARKGDMAMMTFGSSAPVQHVGRLVKPPSGGMVTTVDGNTSVSGSQDAGGACLIRERSASVVVAYVRDS